MRLLERGSGLAVCVDDRGAEHEVALDLVEPVAVGDLVLVHAGVAIGVPR